MSFVYGAPHRENMTECWSKLSLLGQNRDSAWDLSRDFNDIVDNIENVGGHLLHEGSFL